MRISTFTLVIILLVSMGTLKNFGCFLRVYSHSISNRHQYTDSFLVLCTMRIE